MRLLVAAGSGAPRQGPRIREILETAGKASIPVDRVAVAELDRIDPDHKGIILVVEGENSPGREVSLEEFLGRVPATALVLVLDHIEDPQNLGAILRSADAFGVDLVVAPLRRASPLTEAAVRASAGASAWVPFVQVQNLADALRKLQKAGFWVYAADMRGEALDGAALPPRTCFVLGNEGSGVSRLLAAAADGAFSIPMRGHVDSLNVSVAAALCMYEFRRSSRTE